jgi:UDP-N-acetylglucosamine 2-epimerase (non-hydrolysing)
MIQIVNLVGARPNFVKMAPIVAAMKRRSGWVSQLLVHTGQHYGEALSASFLRDLDLWPDVNLGVGSGSHAEQTARVMLALEPLLRDRRPDWVLVVGDVNSTLAGALVASKLGIRLAHVEAGLRSGDWTMPEEINRVLTDRLADLLFTPSPEADANLLREGIDRERIVQVGNVMIDTLHQQLGRARESSILEQLGVAPGQFAVLTLHRAANVDDAATLGQIVGALEEISGLIPIIFPAHPRTRASLSRYGIDLPAGIRLIEPLPYVHFLRLWSSARFVLTDSGGLQDETTVLGVPCLTLRDNTERPITVEQGTNRLVGRDPVRISAAAREVLERPRPSATAPAGWDGQTAERIVEALIARSPRQSPPDQQGVSAGTARPAR